MSLPIKSSIARPVAVGSQQPKVYSDGVIRIRKTLYSVTKRIGGQIITAVWDLDGVELAGPDGEVIAEYSWPPAGTKYAGLGQARARYRK